MLAVCCWNFLYFYFAHLIQWAFITYTTIKSFILKKDSRASLESPVWFSMTLSISNGLNIIFICNLHQKSSYQYRRNDEVYFWNENAANYKHVRLDLIAKRGLFKQIPQIIHINKLLCMISLHNYKESIITCLN